MPDLSSVLTGSHPFSDHPAWGEMKSVFAAAAVPHSWAVRAPLVWQRPLLDALSRLYLCDNGHGDDDCESCKAWRKDESGRPIHPDRTVVGEWEGDRKKQSEAAASGPKAGNVEACRDLIKELALKPVAAKTRLGVVLAADKLLVHAANSLLKIAEEPPSHARLLFLMEGDDLLPTLRSRSRFTAFSVPLSFEARPMPESEADWMAWVENLENLKNLKDGEDFSGNLSSWGSYLLQKGKIEFAARVERLRLLLLQKRLSQTMACDLLILTLKEELPFELISGGFR
jgi:DNA polymerase-3 subunit delta'